MVPLMASSRVAGGLSQSAASSGIYFQGDAQSQHVINSHLGSPFGNSSNSISGSGNSNLGPFSGDMNHTVLSSVPNSGPSLGASSLVTDANSAFSGGPQLQRSLSTNTDSYLRLPASPMSFSSNNISASGSSIIDGPPTGQQISHHDPSSQQGILTQQQQLQQRASSVNSLPSSQTGQIPLAMGSRIANPFVQDPGNLSQLQKKPRLDIKQEDILQQQVLQQLLQRQDGLQLQGHSPQLQAILQQQRLRQQQQILQAMPQMQRVHLQQQQHQQLQLRQHLQQQSLQQMAAMKNSSDTGGMCARRLMQYLYHQQKRPHQENAIAYWRKFVAEYYAPRAKKRWCLSLYDNVGQHALGVFPQASMDAWHCDLCGSKSGRGFEATCEVLPRLNEIKFGSSLIDELLFLDLPRERRFPNGIMILEYAKAVQESVYEQLRVVREGQLRIIFTQELKILSWDFCARRHEELLLRRFIAPQVNQLLQVAQKCQSTHADSGSDGASSQDLQTNSNLVLTASRQLAKSLELPSLNDLGFSKRYVRCLQIAEVVNSMKDLVQFCRDNKFGPIEGLKNYPQHASISKLQNQRMQEMEQHLSNIQGLPTDRNTISKLMAMQPSGINSPNTSSNNGPSMMSTSRGALSGPAAAAMALTNYQNIMMRQNSINSNPNNTVKQEPSTSLNNGSSNPTPSSSFQGFSNPQLAAQHRSLSSNSLSQQSQLSQQQQMMQQLLPDNMVEQKPNLSAQNMELDHNPAASGLGCGGNSGGPPSTRTAVSSVHGVEGPTLSKSSSLKAAGSNSNSSAASGGNGGISNDNNNNNSNNNVSNFNNNQRGGDLSQRLKLTDDMVPDLPHDFAESDFFSSDLDDNMGYGWKS